MGPTPASGGAHQAVVLVDMKSACSSGVKP